MNLVELRPLETKYDVSYKGKVVKLVLDPCECGIHAKWVIRTMMSQTVPPMFRMIFSGAGDSETDYTVRDWHWKPRWWQRLLRHKMEPALLRWVKTSRAEIVDVFEKERRVEELRAQVASSSTTEHVLPGGTAEPSKC